ncbi:MAG: type 1 fimbrial protein [Pseudomonadota bacterium]
MRILVKRTAVAASITAALAMSTSMSSLASDGTITFTGAVTASTCTVKVNNAGTGDGTVTLPTVDTSALTNLAGKTTAAGTFFSMDLSACTAAHDIGSPVADAVGVQVYFEAGPNVNALTGGLINTVTGSNVEVNLYTATDASVVGAQVKPGTNLQAAVQDITAPTSQWFYAGYSTAGAAVAATAGAVSTSVTYSLVYN